MIANYGYRDGSGEYYISIDTDLCISCASGRACVTACPQGLFEIVADDYDDEVACIGESHRRRLAFDCAGCKPAAGYASLPCVTACSAGGIRHSW